MPNVALDSVADGNIKFIVNTLAGKKVPYTKSSDSDYLRLEYYRWDIDVDGGSAVLFASAIHPHLSGDLTKASVLEMAEAMSDEVKELPIYKYFESMAVTTENLFVADDFYSFVLNTPLSKIRVEFGVILNENG